jgi:glycosyltransferase involved in cell wall biosynthesis
MKIKIPSATQVGIGGGISFMRNLTVALRYLSVEIVDENSNDFDILFIAGATLVNREEVEKAKKEGKKIVLRIDNILCDSKNRNTGMPRLLEFAKLADLIIYQSNWAKRLLSPLCGDGVVIKNGVDTGIFYPRQTPKDWHNIRVFYSKYSRNETKNFHEVQYFWREYCIDKKDDTLVLAGRFSDDIRKINHPFEFHNGEKFEYFGICEGSSIANVMRNCDVALLPYFADAMPNTIIEAQACGLPVIYHPYGGSKEAVSYGYEINWNNSPVDMVNFALGNKINFHKEDFEEKFGLKRMGKEYFNYLNKL